MSIKIFGKGLGITAHPFDVVNPVSIDVTSKPTKFVMDTTLKSMGTLNQPETIKKLMEVQPFVEMGTLLSTVQLPNKDIRKNFEMFTLPRPVINTGIKPQLFSADSGNAPFETLFHDFDIEAFPSYNFWTPDELTNDRDARGDRKFEDLPRFIKVVWNAAPDLPDPHERVRPKEVDKRAIRDVMFSREIERPKVFSSRGIPFVPEHLQPANFAKNKSIIANGHLAPGVLEAMVDMPLHNTGVETHRSYAGRDTLDHFDEDAFLTNPAFVGISIHELQAQVSQVTNGIANMISIGGGGVSADLADRKASLVDGKFMIKKSSTPGGRAQIAGIHPSSPTLNFEPKMAMPSKPTHVDQVMQLASYVSQPASVTDIRNSVQVKVKFFNPAIGGLIQPSKVNLMSAPHHVESLSTIATHLPSLEILSRTNLFTKPRQIDIPSLPSPKIKPLEYVGYVLEKYKRQQSGAFIKVEEIDIPSRDADYYIDTKILYGEAYRYRIRAMLRWTRPNEHSFNIPDKMTTVRNASHAATLSTHKSSYFFSEWSHSWAYGSCIDDQPPPPPDELTVRPDSARKKIIVTFRLPDNPQKDILKMRLFKKYKDEHGKDLSHWFQITESSAHDRGIDFAPGNVYYVDDNDSPFGPMEYFQRQHPGIKRVYAAQCVSRHGEYSVLSEQLAACLNEDYKVRGEFPVEFISSPGVRLEYFGAFSTIPNHITKTEIVVTPVIQRVGRSPSEAVLVFTGRNTMGNVNIDNGKYVCRIQSLDTGEVKDIPFTVSLKNNPGRQEVSKFDFYVPGHAVSGKNSDDFDSDSEIKLKNDLTRMFGIDFNDENEEVHSYDRASPGDRWNR